MAIQFKAGKVEAPKVFFVPAGEYKLRIIEAKEDSSKAGNDMIKIKFRVLYKDGTEGPAFGEQIVFSEKSAWKVDQFLKSADKHPGEGMPVALDADNMVGWECKAYLKIRKYEDKNGGESMTNEVGNFIYDEF